MKSIDRLELHTLGGLRLTRDHTPVHGAGARRKSLALLAVLASANSRGVSRDKITALLWPEADAEAARTVLRQTLYSLRRDLDAPDLFLGTHDLRLNTEVIESDLARFEDAMRRHDPRAAVELYHGPFLDAVYLREAPEFDRWAEDERARRAHQFRSALEDLATSATSRADWREAIQWWQRLAQESPTDSRIATRLMHTIASSGDRAAALEYGRKHVAYLEEELGVRPDPAFVAAAERIRDSDSKPKSDHEAPIERQPVPDDVPAADVPAYSPPNAPMRGSRSALVAALLAVVAGVVWVGVRNGREENETPQSAGSALPIVAVLPFSVDGSPDHAYLAEGIPKLLGAGLDGTDLFRSADERAVRAALGGRPGEPVSDAAADSIARRLGADHYIQGAIVFASGRVRIVARLHARSEPPNSITREAEGDTSSVFQLVDELTRELVGANLTDPLNRLAAVASVTTASLPAYKAFLDGEREMRAFRYAAAVTAFRRAIALDPAFALAFHRLSEAADWNGMAALVDSASRQAVAYADRLTDRERRLLEGVRAWRSGETDRSEAILERLVRDYPLDVEAWYHLGEVRFHSAPLRGRPFEASVAPFERTLELQQDHRAALMHLQRALARNGRHKESDALGPRLRAIEGDSGISTQNLLTVYAAGPDSLRASLLSAAAKWPLGSLWDATTQSAVFSRNMVWSNRLARLFTARSLTPSDRRQGILAIALTEAAQGRFQEAERVLASSTEVPPSTLAGVQAALALMPFADSALGVDRLRSLYKQVSQWMLTEAPRDSLPVPSPTHAWLGAYSHGLLSARLGDVNAARRSAALLMHPDTRRASRELSAVFSRSIQAELVRRAGRREEALRFLVDSQPLVSLELQPNFYGNLAHERWMRAELLHELGRLDEALSWYESLAETSINEVAYLAPSHLRRAQIYERQGLRDRAAVHYQRFAELWASSDARLRPLVEDARRRAQTLRVASGPDSSHRGFRRHGAGQ